MQESQSKTIKKLKSILLEQEIVYSTIHILQLIKLLMPTIMKDIDTDKNNILIVINLIFYTILVMKF